MKMPVIQKLGVKRVKTTKNTPPQSPNQPAYTPPSSSPQNSLSPQSHPGHLYNSNIISNNNINNNLSDNINSDSSHNNVNIETVLMNQLQQKALHAFQSLQQPSAPQFHPNAQPYHGVQVQFGGIHHQYENNHESDSSGDEIDEDGPHTVSHNEQMNDGNVMQCGQAGVEEDEDEDEDDSEASQGTPTTDSIEHHPNGVEADAVNEHRTQGHVMELTEESLMMRVKGLVDSLMVPQEPLDESTANRLTGIYHN
jgi:hypothetical protein